MRSWLYYAAGLVAATAVVGCSQPTLIKVKQVPCPVVWPDRNCPPETPVLGDRRHEAVILDLLELHKKCLLADQAKNEARAEDCPDL